MAMVVQAGRRRLFLEPHTEQQKVAEKAQWSGDSGELDAPLAYDPRNLWCLQYGIDQFWKLFSPRQILALSAFANLVSRTKEKLILESEGDSEYVGGVSTYLGEAISKLSTFHNMLAYWRIKDGWAALGLGRQAIPMTWDYAEMNPFAGAGGDWESIVTDAAPRVIRSLPCEAPGVVEQLDAASCDHPKGVCISTDPPYYDNIAYSDLSDFFYVWLRKALQGLYPQLFATVVTPKAEELVASPYRFSGDRLRSRTFFEDGLRSAFGRMHRSTNEDYPVTVFYAFKQTETEEQEDETNESQQEVDESSASTGWETMLEGLIAANFRITGTWPLRTEQTGALKGNVNALASSIVLVCRTRDAHGGLTTRKELMSLLRSELPNALKSLQHGNIAPVDLAQAAIGPGMAVFTRFARVMESDGSRMSVRTALGIINQVLDEVLAEQEGEFDADTRWALAWFEQFGMAEEAFGMAETLSRAKNTAVNGLVEAGIVKAKGGKVKLVSRAELPDGWDPETDKRLTVWESTQHLIRTLETKGESAAASLLNKLGGMGDTARDLAYRLYSSCERKKWADEALAYNSLVIAWPELSKLALAERTSPTGTQGQLF
jgi:putative DNA methylase